MITSLPLARFVEIRLCAFGGLVCTELTQVSTRGPTPQSVSHHSLVAKGRTTVYVEAEPSSRRDWMVTMERVTQYNAYRSVVRRSVSPGYD